jgi:hypothetical protein
MTKKDAERTGTAKWKMKGRETRDGEMMTDEEIKLNGWKQEVTSKMLNQPC